MALLVPRGLLSPNITAWPESHAFSFTQPVIKQSKGREGRGKLSDKNGDSGGSSQRESSRIRQ